MCRRTTSCVEPVKLRCVNFFELHFCTLSRYTALPVSSSLRASRQPMTRWPCSDQPGGLVGALVGLLGPRRALMGPRVLDVDDGPPDQLNHSVVEGKWPRALVTLHRW
jgi:hypothetical protein